MNEKEKKNPWSMIYASMWSYHLGLHACIVKVTHYHYIICIKLVVIQSKMCQILQKINRFNIKENDALVKKHKSNGSVI